MILRSLKLENIRSYSSGHVEFPEGSVLLSGDIGSGKSTILLAIEFALFGIIRSELSGNSLMRHGKNNGSVELRFDIGRDEYIVKRTLKKSKDFINQDSGYLITNGRKFEGTPIELKAKILEILGYPSELVSSAKSVIFRYTVYTPQEQMKQILFEEKDSRLDSLRKLFGIDKYKNIKGNAVIFIREIKRKQAELEIKIEIFEELEKEKKDKEQKAETLEKNLAALREELDKTTKEVEETRQEIRTLEEKQKKLNSLRNRHEVTCAHLGGKTAGRDSFIKRINELEPHITSLKNKLAFYSDINEPINEKELEDQLAILQDNFSGLVARETSIKEKLRSAEDQILNIESEISNFSEDSKESIKIKAKLTETEEKLAKKEEQEKMLLELEDKEKKALIALDRINISMNEVHNTLRSIKDADICPVCEQKVEPDYKSSLLTKEHAKIDRFEEEKKNIGSLVEKILANKEKVNRNLEKIRQIDAEYRKDREHLVILESSVKQLVKKQKELSALYERKKEFSEQLKEKSEDQQVKKEIEIKKIALSFARDHNLKLREKKNIFELISREKENLEHIKKEIEACERDIRAFTEQKLEIESQLLGFFGIEEKYSSWILKFNASVDLQKQASIRLASVEQEKKSLQIQVNELEKKISSLEKIKSRISELSSIEQWFEDFFLNLMTTIERHIMASIHKEFSFLLQEWFSVLIEDLEISLDDGFSPVIIQNGYETDIDSLSGGEKTSVALAYRLALNKVVNDLIPNIRTKGLIILDEPTDGFSSEQLDKVREVLDMLKMRQTILVSHEPKMESYVSNIIRVAKNGDSSSVS